MSYFELRHEVGYLFFQMLTQLFQPFLETVRRKTKEVEGEKIIPLMNALLGCHRHNHYCIFRTFKFLDTILIVPSMYKI